MERGQQTANSKSLGLAACTALVVGNMVGSGFYLSPAALAPYGNLAILGWIVMGGGAMCLGLTFAKLASLAPATGGPYAYTRLAYGDFAGFLIAWGYWISIWASLPAIAIAFAGAVMDMAPGLHNRTMAVVLTLGAIWGVVLINLRGVKAAGIFMEITTYSKLVPFAAIALIGLFYVDRSNFMAFDSQQTSLFTAGAAVAPITMFAFLGTQVSHGSGRRCKRCLPYNSAINHPRHRNCHVALCAGHGRRHGIGVDLPAGEFNGTILGCGPCYVGTMGRHADFFCSRVVVDRRP